MKRSTCLHCHRPLPVCYCHTLKQIANFWPVHILQHPRESKHAIGTANIAALSLTNCKLQIGENFTRESISTDEHQAVLIYPGKDAGSLASLKIQADESQAPQTLIFLDASWRKSRRMLMESPELQSLPKISLHPGHVSRYRIRKSKHPDSLSTLEAIVHTLAVLEQEEEKYLPLLQSMDWMIEKQISLIGEAVFKKNYSDDQ